MEPSFCPIARATRSDTEPAAKPTTIRTGLFG